MEGELQLDNILTSEEIENLFVDSEENQETTPPEETKEVEKTETKKETKDTTEVNVDDLFTEKPESVGSEDNKEGTGDTSSEKGGSSSNNFYSSIAKALQEEGIFPDLNDEDFNGVSDAEGFRDLIEKQVQSQLDERQKRIDEALNLNIEPSEIKKYENTIGYLDSIKEDALSKEDATGEKLRKQLIYQDFINRGYSDERAKREVQKSFNAGTDIDDAKEALKSNKEYYQEAYNDLLEEAKAEDAKVKEEMKKQTEALKTSILQNSKVFGDVEVDKATRQKVFDNISKPVYKDPETGQYYTAIQKYQKENSVDFIKNVGILYTLTDGFKDINKLIKGSVRKEVNKGLKNLEKTIADTRRTPDGNLQFVSSVEDDPNSVLTPGWSVDV